jgi:hypothetical protein
MGWSMHPAQWDASLPPTALPPPKLELARSPSASCPVHLRLEGPSARPRAVRMTTIGAPSKVIGICSRDAKDQFDGGAGGGDDGFSSLLGAWLRLNELIVAPSLEIPIYGGVPKVK